MAKALLYVAALLIGLMPAAAGIGIGFAVSVGGGITVGAVLYLAVGVWLLMADLGFMPDAPTEVAR